MVEKHVTIYRIGFDEVDILCITAGLHTSVYTVFANEPQDVYVQAFLEEHNLAALSEKVEHADLSRVSLQEGF